MDAFKKMYDVVFAFASDSINSNIITYMNQLVSEDFSFSLAAKYYKEMLLYLLSKKP